MLADSLLNIFYIPVLFDVVQRLGNLGKTKTPIMEAPAPHPKADAA
jgi:hypothetical protein